MFVDPSLLERIAHAHQKQVGPGVVDPPDDVGGQVAIEEETVMVARGGPAREGSGGGGGGPRDRASAAAEEEVAIALTGGRVEQLRHEVGADEVVAHADALQPGGPADPRAVAEDVVGRVEHVAIGRIGGRQVERMGVDEVDGSRRPGPILQ